MGSIIPDVSSYLEEVYKIVEFLYDNKWITIGVLLIIVMVFLIFAQPDSAKMGFIS